MTENEISFKIRGAIYKVSNEYGPGLFESAYEAILIYELKKEGLTVESQVELPLIHETLKLDVVYRIDLLIYLRKSAHLSAQICGKYFL